MIEEAYISYEVAKLMKNKGFDFGLVRGQKCTQQMAMRWLREKCNKVICISMGHDENEGNHDHCNPDKWYFIFEVVNNKGVYREEEQPDPFTNEYATYEEAVEAALKYCLENLI